MNRPPTTRQAAPALTALAVLLAAMAWLLSNADRRVAAIALSLAALGLALLLYALIVAWRRQAAAEADEAKALRDELTQLRASQAARGAELALLGRYGNLLLGCTDLAEVLQTSQQMLSQLLPEIAGTIYPLIDGEGLAEATHLWGSHAAESEMQASSDECCSMRSRRLHLWPSEQSPGQCGHVLAGGGDPLRTACVPLLAQGEALGWLYLSAPGETALPRLQVAVAAADQLALALGNLKLRQNLRDLSVRDPLTNLFNRRYLSESLGRELARVKRRNLPMAVLAFDLDHFKDFNDRFGHAAGDAVLVSFARILQRHSRNEDIACRQGGEEFVLIMPEMDRQVAFRRATELMRMLAETDIVHEGQQLPSLTTSVGLAVFPEHAGTPEELLSRADEALYAAKAMGRNCIYPSEASVADS